jgi:bifunctional DNA-binding transcriptional regulator/antitoxin component of YhaV-PrlF toxin-antitoxin module
MPSRTAQAENPARTSGVSRIGQRRQVVIPKQISDALALAGGFHGGTAENGCVTMKPKKLVDAGDTLTAADAKKLRQALRQLKAGKTKTWSQVKHGLRL